MGTRSRHVVVGMDISAVHPAWALLVQGSGIFVRENGQTKEISREEWDTKFPDREPVVCVNENEYIFRANITHNLGTMANHAGIYEVLWHPDERDITHAHQLITPLKEGLHILRADPEHYKQYNPENGWGDYDGLVSFVERYLEACEKYPSAEVKVWG